MPDLANIEHLEADLWDAADNLRANSKLTAGEYCMPVLGVIFLRHATNRYNAALREIEADQASGKMPKRAPINADFKKRRALMLPKEARYDVAKDWKKPCEKKLEQMLARNPQRMDYCQDQAGEGEAGEPGVNNVKN